MESYRTRGTCSKQIIFEIENNIIKSIKFINGCSGNAQGIAKLCQNMKIDDIIAKLSGIQCRQGTSCPDQLAKALEEYKQKNNL